MIDVLKRRAQIENYLSNLNLDKPQDAVARGVDLNSAAPITANLNRKKDSVISIPKELTATPKDLPNLSNTKTVATAIDTKKEAIGMAVPKEIKQPEIKNAIVAAPVLNKTYSFNPADTQYVVVMMKNVDPIFITEGRNAFNRYNQESYSGQNIEIYNRKINGDFNFLMCGPFTNAGAAIGYVDRTKPLAKTRIIPWLTPDKYSFSIISNANMKILIDTQDIDGYNAFIHQVFPDKF
jgi:hypothetical protein